MALQASSQHVQTSIPPDAFAIDGPTSRRQYAQQSPQMGDGQFPAVSPSSSRRPSRRPSGNGSQPATPQQTQHRSPNTTHTSGSSTARLQPSNQTSPRTPTAASTQLPSREQAGDHDRRNRQPISPPPRTSSQQRNANQNSFAEESVPEQGRHAGDTLRQQAREVEQSRGEPAESSSAPTRARITEKIAPDASQRSTNVQGPRSQQSPTATRGGTTPNSRPRPVDMSRENSEVLSRMVVTDPETDLIRERERLAEAIPARGQSQIAGQDAAQDAEDANRAPPRSRQDFSANASKRKETKFGDYILGQTLGEGEFGKVKLGWKKDGSVQVAIKLIRRENLNANPTRLPKIYREINILTGLSHPNIVRLHEKVETERHIGIILEYASGGELFDYILTHRYLKDSSARRLFAQLVSGVGYLHKKGIVHRDLKLENLLLDRNRNIIITDFGFANTFDPTDELGEEIEYNLTNKEFVKKMDLERVRNGFRRGDLMQTSCGSPCYAAPELVVTDSLYTGRKVDVWSCGVILYAMLAGYLPFDDDPSNPEGDNINLLYKYIVSTPLTFPEYVTPHARDLLRQILVPDPRDRADLFEVARHSWLSEYAHVVAHITSSTSTIGDISNTLITQDRSEAPLLARSASVREPSKPYAANVSPVGGLSHQGKIDPEAESAKMPRDPKRRTVQVEYVAPPSQTARGEISLPPQVPTMGSAPDSAGRPLPVARGPVESSSAANNAAVARKALPKDPPNAEGEKKYATASTYRTPAQSGMLPPARPAREPPRSVSESAGAFGQVPPTSNARPNTGGSMSSTSAGRLPSRGNSYSQPLAPKVAATTAQGKVTQPPQPKGSRAYNISAPIPQPEPYISDMPAARPVFQRTPSDTKFGASGPKSSEGKGHKRSSTLSNMFGKPGSFFGVGKSQDKDRASQPPPKFEKKYPPTSMKQPIASESPPRRSTDSRRPSLSFGRKNSDLSRSEKSTRRFSLLPASFSLKNFTGGSRDQSSDTSRHYPDMMVPSTPHSKSQSLAYGRESYDSQRYEDTRNASRNVSAPILGGYEQPPRSAPAQPSSPDNYATGAPAQYPSNNTRPLPPGHSYYIGEPSGGGGGPTESDLSIIPRVHLGPQAGQKQQQQQQPYQQNAQRQQHAPRYPPGFNEFDEEPPRASMQAPGHSARVLQKPNRKFADAWEQDQQQEPGHGHRPHSGTSGAARRVMDFFRKRGKARTGDDS